MTGQELRGVWGTVRIVVKRGIVHRLFGVRVVWVLLAVSGCGDGASTDGSTSIAPSDEPSFVDEPLPTLEQLESAPDCDTLNLLMVAVQGEDFRADVDLTLAEEMAGREALGTDEPEGAFDAYYRAFSDRQGDLGCSDAEMMAVLDNAHENRCRAWLAAGHSADEEPLLFNTDICLDFADG